MPDNYAATVLYKADIERELYNRASTKAGERKAAARAVKQIKNLRIQ